MQSTYANLHPLATAAATMRGVCRTEIGGQRSGSDLGRELEALWQVMQEFFIAATRKVGRARRRVELLAQLDVVLVRPDVILGAINVHRLRSISFWDAFITKCASAAGCARLLSEDLGDGDTIDGVRIENPFAAIAADSPA